MDEGVKPSWVAAVFYQKNKKQKTKNKTPQKTNTTFVNNRGGLK